MKAIKKVIVALIIAVVGVGAANAELRFGIKAGLNLNNLHLNDLKSSNIKDYIYSVAEDLYTKSNLDEIHIQNKIVLAIAIRLKAEDYMINKLKQIMPVDDFNDFYNHIKWNQTSAIIKKFEALCIPDNNIQLLIKDVNLITPENIHLNSFMFEPLLDMSVWRLKNLFNDIKMHLVR